MSSAEGGLELVIAEELWWFMYCCWCRARASAEGDGMEIAGDWWKSRVSY